MEQNSLGLPSRRFADNVQLILGTRPVPKDADIGTGLGAFTGSFSAEELEEDPEPEAWLLPLLKRPRWTHPQTTVIPSQRDANVKQSFAARRVDLTGYQVLLIDDIKTSGASVGACCKLLKECGARSIHVAVAAVADPRGMDFQRKM